MILTFLSPRDVKSFFYTLWYGEILDRSTQGSATWGKNSECLFTFPELENKEVKTGGKREDRNCKSIWKTEW